MCQPPPPVSQPSPPPPSPPPPSDNHHRWDETLTVGGDPENFASPDCVGRSKRNRVYVDTISSKTNIESFVPDDLLFDIFLHLRAKEIHGAAMFVCRKWYDMLRSHNFVYSHLEKSTPGLFILYNINRLHPVFVSMVEGEIKMYKTDYEFEDLCWSGCNGLTLVCHPTDGDGLCISNGVTKQLLELPKFSTFSPTESRDYAYCGIAYAASSMEYKVVCTSNSTKTARIRCAILSVGVDKSWRHVRTRHLSLESKELLTKTPLTSEGFLHWTCGKVGTTRILTLNAETEVITEIRVPQGRGQESRYFLSNGRSLTVLVSCGEFRWDVWELKKPEIGEWEEMMRIDLGREKWNFERIYNRIKPVGWLNYYEALVLQVCRPPQGCLVYNVGTRKIEFLELRVNCYSVKSLVHKNSLVWLDG